MIDVRRALAALIGAISFSVVGTLFCCSYAAAQTPPVITGPNGATSAAFWYLGGITPNCCNDIVNKYWTIWAVTLATNTSDPNPTIIWSTDSPSKVTIAANGTVGATLTAAGHSAPGTGYDINIWVTVDGIQSAMFPVYINTPWTATDPAPFNASTCSQFPQYPNGYYSATNVYVQDLTGRYLVPIDLAEAWENDKPIYPGENWGMSTNGTWAANNSWKTDAAGNGYIQDAYITCWGIPAPTPQTVQWSTSGTTAINSDTQKYFYGTLSPFTGQCPERKAVVWYTDHVAYSTKTTPITDPTLCQRGKFAN